MSVATRTEARGLLYTATGPAPLLLPLGSHPPGSWSLVDLNSRTWQRIAGNATTVPLSPRGTYLALFPRTQQLVLVRASTPSTIELGPTRTQHRTATLRAKPVGGGGAARLYLGQLDAPPRRPGPAGRLVAGEPGQHLVLLPGPGGSIEGGRVVARTLSAAATIAGAIPGRPALMALPQTPVERLLNESGQAG